jgi:RCC1 and BTB domain-containing protein
MSGGYVTTATIVQGLFGRNVRLAYAGISHSMVITDEGELYVWGNNASHQLGTGTTAAVTSPIRVSLHDKTIIGAACGLSHSLAISDEGEIYGWGNNAHNQLGTGNTSALVTPQQLHILSGRKIIQVACGDNHTLTVVGNVASLAESTYTQDFQSALNQSDFSDVTFVVEGQRIYAHKFVLFTRCKHFLSMFKHEMKEQQTNEIVIKDTSYISVYAFLEYLYTDSTTIPPQNAMELLNIGNMYQLERLKQLCEKLIRRNISIDSAADIFRGACTYQADELQTFALRFIMKNFGAVVKTESFAKLDKDLIVSILRAIPSQRSF